MVLDLDGDRGIGDGFVARGEYGLSLSETGDGGEDRGLELNFRTSARRSGSEWDSVLGWGLEMMVTPSRMPCKEEPQPQVSDKGYSGKGFRRRDELTFRPQPCRR